MINVVGTMFFKNKKLLLDKPRKRPTHQMIGGRVEDGETPLEAAIREAHEELGENAIFNSENFKFVMEFDEIATSDPNLKIHFYVFTYEGELEGELTTSDEIESFLWYDTSCGQDILSHTLKNEVVPYCVKNALIS
ncbi:MAG: NUDIX hydrolase [Clostridia bacterium]|nr:NUDIX hydrolase [Clostridia bacterium]